MRDYCEYQDFTPVRWKGDKRIKLTDIQIKQLPDELFDELRDSMSQQILGILYGEEGAMRALGYLFNKMYSNVGNQYFQGLQHGMSYLDHDVSLTDWEHRIRHRYEELDRIFNLRYMESDTEDRKKRLGVK